MTMAHYILAIDQGTTGTTALVVDAQLQVKGRGYCEVKCDYPALGWVEQSPLALWHSARRALTAALQEAGVTASEIAGVAIANQRETVVAFDKSAPLEQAALAPAIVWQDRRTAALCEQLNLDDAHQWVKARTGLVIDPYFSATKMQWLLREYPAVQAAQRRGVLCLGTVDTWLIHCLSGGEAQVTDVSNASRTLLFDLHELQWSRALCDFWGVDREALARVVSSGGVCAHVKEVTPLRDGTPIAALMGDQQAALFGQCCFEPGDAKCTLGTGAFALMNAGHQPVQAEQGLLSTVAWQMGDSPCVYALEGSAFICGALVQWLKDELQLIRDAAEIETLAAQVSDSGGVTIVPALCGLGAPHWRPDARGMITGLTRGTGRAHIARAALEAIALQNSDLLEAMARHTAQLRAPLRIDGGAARNNLLMQLHADVLRAPVARPLLLESTALGAAMAAGLALGMWSNLSELARHWQAERHFTPDPAQAKAAEALRKRFHQAIRQCV